MKKIFPLIALFSALSISVFAEEDLRNVITYCPLNGYDPSVIRMGENSYDASMRVAETMVVPQGAIWYNNIPMAGLKKLDPKTGSYNLMNKDSVITPGKYKFSAQIRIEDKGVKGSGNLYRFPIPETGEKVKVVVSGEEWRVETTGIGTGFSFIFIESPYFELYAEGIGSAPAKETTSKEIQNGQLLIHRGEKTYTAAGLEVKK